MFNVTENGENRLDIEMSGKLNSDDMKVALDELLSKAEGVRKGKILYKMIDFNLPSLGAIGVELSRLPSLFGLMGKFNRIAVLTDETWLQKASEIKGALIPGLDMKAFNLNQEKDAEAWLSK